MDIEASQSDDEFDDPDDETAAMERERQAAESVPLRRREEVDRVLQVARKWESYARQGERATQEKRSRAQKTRTLKRKETANPPATSRPQKRARTEKTSLHPPPPPNTKPVTVQTTQGQVIIHVQVIPGESELDFQTRVYDMTEAAHAEANKETVAVLRTCQVELQVGKGIVPRPSVTPPPSRIVPPTPSLEILPEDKAPTPTFSRLSLSPPPTSSASEWLQKFEARLFADLDNDADWPIEPMKSGGGTPPVHRSSSRSPFQGGALTPAMATTPVHHSCSRSPYLNWQGGALTPARPTTPVDRSSSRVLSQNWQSGALTPAGGSTPVQGSCSLPPKIGLAYLQNML